MCGSCRSFFLPRRLGAHADLCRGQKMSHRSTKIPPPRCAPWRAAVKNDQTCMYMHAQTRWPPRGQSMAPSLCPPLCDAPFPISRVRPPFCGGQRESGSGITAGGLQGLRLPTSIWASAGGGGVQTDHCPSLLLFGHTHKVMNTLD